MQYVCWLLAVACTNAFQKWVPLTNHHAKMAKPLPGKPPISVEADGQTGTPGDTILGPGATRGAIERKRWLEELLL